MEDSTMITGNGEENGAFTEGQHLNSEEKTNLQENTNLIQNTIDGEGGNHIREWVNGLEDPANAEYSNGR